MRRAILATACALDAALGDPLFFPHPVQLFGAAIALVEHRRRAGTPGLEIAAGAFLTLALTTAAWFLGRAADRAPVALRVTVAASTLSARSLDDAVRHVREALARDDLAEARRRLARIVGRDTEHLDAAEISRAALESLAESFCDGTVAPLLALRVGGCAAALAFKAVSTLDSTIGHIEAPYTFFGRVAARADDVANLVPARIAATALALVAPFLGGDGRAALLVAVRDASGHRSPNAGWPEAALAGALGVRLGGNNRYAGTLVPGATFNASARAPGVTDISRGLRVVRAATLVCALAACAS